MEKKIATSVDILINVAKYEHISVTKYAETKITYETDEEMKRQEDDLTADLIDDVKRSLAKCSEGFGKKVEAINDFEEKMQKKIPEWLEAGPEPNIANEAKKAYVENTAEAHTRELEDKAQKLEQDKMTTATATEMEELFGSDAPAEEKKEETGVEKKGGTKNPHKRGGSDDMVVEDDDDLFA